MIAIPAKNEQDRIVSCLLAIGTAIRNSASLFRTDGIVVVVNNSTDETVARIRSIAALLPCPVIIRTVTLLPHMAHAGAARRIAADLAATFLECAEADGALLMTDADTLVDHDWMLRHAEAFNTNVDVIAGRVRMNAEDVARWPATLCRRQEREDHLAQLLSALAELIDPETQFPLQHDQASGASLGTLVSAYRRSGGIPILPVGEDRAFIARAKRAGCLVRHDPRVTVTTSGRLTGRAPGGAADTISRRASDGGARCDDRLETAEAAVRRLLLRRDLRRWHGNRRTDWIQILRAHLGPISIPGRLRGDIEHAPTFQAFWQILEDDLPAFQRQPLRSDQIDTEIARTRFALRSIAPASTNDPCARDQVDRRDAFERRVVAKIY